MNGLFDEPEGATPVDPDERADLIPDWVTTRADLNEVEQANILRAVAWARRRRHDLFNERFVRTLHERMFGDVWKWAGRYRRTGKNIGIEWSLIPNEVPAMLDQVRYWTERKIHSSDEIGVRLHHWLTQIHPFPNGNGRHARLMADLFQLQLGLEPFSWGRQELSTPSEVRRRYIAALKEADNHNIARLLLFARS